MKTLWTLLLDCSFYGLTLGLAKDGVLADRYVTDVARSSGLMHPELENMLTRQGIKLAEVGKLVVTVGPGSFTGIRLGLAFAEALKVAVPDIEVVGIGTMQAVAASFTSQKGAEVWLDAAGGQVFVQRFDAGRNPLGVPVCLTMDEALAGRDTALELVVGMGVSLNVLPEAVVGHIAPEAMLELAGRGVDEALVPVYIKPLEYRRAGA